MQPNEKSTFTHENHYDIIVVGAGMVGLTFANLCAQHNFSVALVDRKPPILNWDPLTYDLRVSAISRASQTLFESLGVWEAMQKEGVNAYPRMQVWEASGFGKITFSAEEVNEPDLGHIIENRIIVKALWEKLEHSKNVTRYLPATVKKTNVVEEAIILELDQAPEQNQDQKFNQNQLLYSKLLVGADGAQSWVRGNQAIQTKNWEYKQKALVATVTTELPHENTAWQRFLKNGPLAFLPLKDPFTSSIVWSTAIEQADRLLTVPHETFCEELGFNFDYRLGKITSVQDRACFPLTMRHADHYIGQRVALLGDAAHVIHPFAGLGVNLGIMDAHALMKVLEQARSHDNDIGHPLILRRFERQRRTEVLVMITALEGIKRLFDAHSSAISLIRGMAINGIDRTSFLKKIFIRQALGC